MLRYVLIILLSLLINFELISNSHAAGGGIVRSIIQFFKSGAKNTIKGADDLIRNGSKSFEKIFRGSDESLILEKIGKENHTKNYFIHSKRVIKQNRRFLRDLVEEGTEQAIEELSEEGFQQAAERGVENLSQTSDFYNYVTLSWIGRIYAKSEYYSKPKVEKEILLTCKTDNEIFYFSIIMEDKIKSASLIDHKYLLNSSQLNLFEQELFVLEDLGEFKIMSTRLEPGYNYPKHYFTIFANQSFIYDKIITGTENPGIIINRAHQYSIINKNKCYKASENGLL